MKTKKTRILVLLLAVALLISFLGAGCSLIQVDPEKDKKQVLLRLSSSLWQELVTWSEDDFRSLNGQIEYLLTECVKKRKKTKGIGENHDI